MARVDTAEIHIASLVNGTFRVLRHGNDRRFSIRVKYWEIIADNLSKAGWSWGCVSAMDFDGSNDLGIADAHCDNGSVHRARG
ncbi:MAG: hypothetical protein DME33_02755 [Verrucomicrobia bacterium]|nr:MAG: hypothetical protein DME33_02755 [Verrucomicrobiota bacterium]